MLAVSFSLYSELSSRTRAADSSDLIWGKGGVIYNRSPVLGERIQTSARKIVYLLKIASDLISGQRLTTATLLALASAKPHYAGLSRDKMICRTSYASNRQHAKRHGLRCKLTHRASDKPTQVPKA